MVQPLDSERLVDALSREVGQFEEKVGSLEAKCSHIRDCIAALAETLRQSRNCFSTSGAGLPASCSSVQAPGALSPLRIAESCGIKDHVELIRSAKEPDLVVHEPGDRSIIFVDGQLRGLEGPLLAEAARRRLKELGAMPADQEGAEVVKVLYVPADPAECGGGYEQLLEEAEGRRIAVATPAALLSMFAGVALRWLTFTCGQNARAVVDRGQDLVDVVSAFIADFTETEKLLCELVNDCALTSRRRQETSASLHA